MRNPRIFKIEVQPSCPAQRRQEDGRRRAAQAGRPQTQSEEEASKLSVNTAVIQESAGSSPELHAPLKKRTKRTSFTTDSNSDTFQRSAPCSRPNLHSHLITTEPTQWQRGSCGAGSRRPVLHQDLIRPAGTLLRLAVGGVEHRQERATSLSDRRRRNAEKCFLKLRPELKNKRH